MIYDIRAEQAMACRKLWGSVLLRALQDALTPDKKLSVGGSGTSFADRRAAKKWIGTQDFYDVCRLAGFEPEFILLHFNNGRIMFEDIATHAARGAAE